MQRSYLMIFCIFSISIFLVVGPLFAQVGEECPVIGIKRNKQFATAKQVRCFNRKGQAKLAGYTSIKLAGLGYSVPLRGAEEVPPIDSDNSGDCNVVLSADQETLSVACILSFDTAIAAHLHEGEPGVSGSVICGFGVGGSSISASCTLTAEQAELVRSGQTYINVHTPEHPTGEIRGQVD